MTWEKIGEFLVLTFISFQGVLLLCVPQIRNRLYETISSANSTPIPLLQSIAEHGRLLVAVALIPTCTIPKSWIIFRFISLISYVLYICIIYNLYMFHTYFHVAQFIFQLLVLTKFIFIVVDDLTEIEFQERRVKRRRLMEERQEQIKSVPKAAAEKVEKTEKKEIRHEEAVRHQEKPRRKK